MEKLLLILSAVFILIISSCSNPSAHFLVWRGNNDYSRGDYQSSNINYLKAQKVEEKSSFINYNLGNVYYSLGEPAAALEEWQKAIITKNDELLFRVLFNRGVLEFEGGQYQKAFDSFRSALEIIPESIETKRNLEYSLKKMNAGVNQKPLPLAGAQTKDNQDFNDVNRVLEFIKQKENYILKNLPMEKSEKTFMDW